MSGDKRIDKYHPKLHGPDRSVLVTTSLDRAQAIQTLALNTRNEINFQLKAEGATPEAVAEKVALHGDPTYHPEIVDAALMLEFAKPGEDGSKGAVVRTLELMSKKLGTVSRVPSNGAMKTRLQNGGTPRVDDSDVSPEAWESLMQDVSPELREIMEQLRTNNSAYRQTLDRHDKFSEMLNSKAFERDLNASKKPGTFIFFDLINFKNYNSRYSYDFVDEIILKNLCAYMKKELPSSALLSIKGGDEFMIFIPDDAAEEPINTRVAASVVAMIVEEAMASITPEQIQEGKKLLIGRKKQPLGVLSRYFTGWISRGDDQAAKNARDQKETERILQDVRNVHGKISAVKRTPDMRCGEAVQRTEAGLKKVSSWHYRANMRFPSSVVEDNGELSEPFSATGAEVRDFFVGAKNDFKDLVARLLR